MPRVGGGPGTVGCMWDVGTHEVTLMEQMATGQGLPSLAAGESQVTSKGCGPTRERGRVADCFLAVAQAEQEA